MPIKKSSLEQKWYYRAAKVFFLILPLIVAIFLLLNKNAITCNVSPTNIFDTLQKDIVYIIIGLILYFLILTAIWRSFLYIVFGGLEDDTKTETTQPINSDTQLTPVKPKPNKIAQWIAIIIIICALAILILSRMGYITSTQKNSNSFTSPNVNSISGSNCPATSAQTATPCHSVKSGIGVGGVIVPDRCQCPSDTTYAGMDNITAGGPYKMCTCNK